MLYRMQQTNHLDISYSWSPRDQRHRNKIRLKIKHHLDQEIKKLICIHFQHADLHARLQNYCAFFWDYSEIGLLGIEQNERKTVYSEYAFFWNFWAGNRTLPPAPDAWPPVGRRSSSQVTSVMRIPFSE